MKPLDPRLLRHARAARGYILTTSATGILLTGLVVAQVLLIAHILAPAVDGGPSGPSWLLPALAAVFAARVLVLIVQESLAHRAAGAVIADLRGQVVDHEVARGPRHLDSARAAETLTLVTRGLDDLAPYFTRYLPQLVLAATLTPVTLTVVLFQDLTSGFILAGAIPMIPVFMWLVGLLTQKFSEKRIAIMDRLGAQLLDLLAGLATLKALGREKGPAARIRLLGEAYTKTTMSTLRVAFLSGAILEFIASLSVALVAVVVGMRLVFGNVDLVVALAVIMLAPEVLMPLRQVGTHFHASTDGMAAADAVFRVLETPTPGRGTTAAPDLRSTVLRLTGLSVRAPGRDVVAPYDLSGELRPGTVTAVVGPTGSGKSTTALMLLGLLQPDEGEVVLETADGPIRLSEVDLSSYHPQIAWVPQRPTIVPGTVLSNVLGAFEGDGASAIVPAAVEHAARLADFDSVIASLPRGWSTRVGQGGVGLSVGQRQRLALTRALVHGAPLAILDEPSAHLDAASEEVVVNAARHLAESGSTVVVIAHRPAMIGAADHVLTVRSRNLSEGVPS